MVSCLRLKSWRGASLRLLPKVRPPCLRCEIHTRVFKILDLLLQKQSLIGHTVSHICRHVDIRYIMWDWWDRTAGAFEGLFEEVFMRCLVLKNAIRDRNTLTSLMCGERGLSAEQSDIVLLRERDAHCNFLIAIWEHVNKLSTFTDNTGNEKIN